MAQFGGGTAGGDARSVLQPDMTRTYSRIGSQTQTQIIHNGSSVEFSDITMSGTKIMYANISDNAGGNTLDTVHVRVTCYNTELFNSTSRKFVPRRYTITPASDGPGTITLYYTQADFDAYNLQAAYNFKLPENGTDIENYKANLRIYRCVDNYESPNLITMASPLVAWNANDSSWSVTFNTIDLMGGHYYVGTPFLSSKMVTGLTHTSQTPGICQTSATVTIDWDSIVGASDYRLRFRAQGNPNWNTSTILPSQRVVPNLSFNTTYEVQVRVRENTDLSGNTNIQGEYTQTYSFTTPAPPLYPACVTPSPSLNTVGQTSATINWPSIQDATGYLVEMRIAGTGTWGGTTIQGTSHTMNGLTPNTTYYYRVRTNCNLANACSLYSAYSAEQSFTTQPLQPVLITCMPPTNIQSGVITKNGATLSWNAADSASIYLIQIRPSTSLTWGGNSTTSTSRTYSNLAPNTEYQYRIRTTCKPGTAINANSIFSPIYTFTTSPLVSQALFDQQEHAWLVFPNPTRNLLHVQFNAEQELPVQFQWFDITGRLVKSAIEHAVKGNNQMEFDLASLTQGIYMMKVTQQNNVLHIQRIQKN
ncbi:MAG: T9SS type A sorting domain-containing protein [Chitinophagaceae bacterium]|nr:T9SS type A sorting domain-containing protein [Chitinophagaceae bacterium]